MVARSARRRWPWFCGEETPHGCDQFAPATFATPSPYVLLEARCTWRSRFPSRFPQHVLAQAKGVPHKKATNSNWAEIDQYRWWLIKSYTNKHCKIVSVKSWAKTHGSATISIVFYQCIDIIEWCGLGLSIRHTRLAVFNQSVNHSIKTGTSTIMYIVRCTMYESVPVVEGCGFASAIQGVKRKSNQ